MSARFTAAAALIALALVCGAVAPAARSDPPAPPPATKVGKSDVPAKQVTVVVSAPMNADTAELAKTKVATAKAAYEATFKAFREGKADAEKVYLWSRRWMGALRDASDKQGDRVAAVEAHLDRMKALREIALANYKSGKVPHTDVIGADFYVAEGELWLAQAKAK